MCSILGTISRTEKTGKIYLFSFNKDAKELNPIQVVETAPMFDQKWCQYTVGGKPTLGVVDSFGALKIYSLTVENEIAFLTLISEAVIKNDPLSMTQSLDWSNNKFNSKPSVSISDSFGNVTIVQLDESQDIQTVQSWKAHEKDALICAFDSWNPSTVFTGMFVKVV